jgi:hypothetical protein
LALRTIFIGGAGLLTGCASAPPLHFDAKQVDGICQLQFDGRTVDLRTAEQELRKIAQSTPSRRAIANADKSMPYRCIGGALFWRQVAGFRRVDFTVDGKPMKGLMVR